MPKTTSQTCQTVDLVIGLDELAKVLRKTPDYLKRNWRRMHQKLGMPRKHDAGDIWPRKQIEIWLTGPSAVAAAPGNDNAGQIPAAVHEARVSAQNEALKGLLGVRS